MFFFAFHLSAARLRFYNLTTHQFKILCILMIFIHACRPWVYLFVKINFPPTATPKRICWSWNDNKFTVVVVVQPPTMPFAWVRPFISISLCIVSFCRIFFLPMLFSSAWEHCKLFEIIMFSSWFLKSSKLIWIFSYDKSFYKLLPSNVLQVIIQVFPFLILLITNEINVCYYCKKKSHNSVLDFCLWIWNVGNLFFNSYRFIFCWKEVIFINYHCSNYNTAPPFLIDYKLISCLFVL